MNTNNDKAENVKTIRELLGIEDDFELPVAPATQAPTAPAPVFVLPTVEIEPAPVTSHDTPVKVPAGHEPAVSPKRRLPRLLSRDFVRYPIIFLVTLGFFYLVLNFRGLTKQLTGYIFPPQSNQEAVLGDEAGSYESWIKRYYVYINDEAVIAANADTDFDGLTNMDEFHLGTNPFRRDTDRDGIDDGKETLLGTNPLYEGTQLVYQQEIIAEHIDTGVIESRREFNNQGLVAGENQGLPLAQEKPFIVDTARPGEISIPRLGVTAPITWSRAFATMEEDLKFGVAHHPQTPYPGERGTASIHGHSSGNWNDGNFKTVFTKINFLEPGDEVFVSVHAVNGETRRYRFIVRSEKVYAKTDQAQFNAGDGYFLNLSTSWPVGTARERYVVTTELAGL